MLTIQPNLTVNRTHSMTSFGHSNPVKDLDDDYNNYPAAIYDEPEDDYVTEKENDLESVKNDINQAMADLKDVQNDLPPAAKRIMGGLFTLGAAAVAGISTKFGFSETSKVFNNLAHKPSVKNFSGNVKNSISGIGKAIKNWFIALKETRVGKYIVQKSATMADKFMATAVGKKLVKGYDYIADSKFVKTVKGWFAKAKDIKGQQVVDRTGDVLGTATGVSTAAVGVIDPEKKAQVEG